MARTPVTFEKIGTEILAGGKVVGETDRAYQIDGTTVTFNDVLVKGDLSGELEYNGAKLRVIRVNTIIGLEVTPNGVRGPVWKGVECEVIN